MAGRFRALLILAWSLVRALIARAGGRPNGIAKFRSTYREDRLLPLSRTERDIITTFSGCIACGLCDAGEGERMAQSKGAYPGIMRLVLASSRSMPDFDAGALGFAYVPEEVLASKEDVCPARIPFRQLAHFVRQKAAETAA